MKIVLASLVRAGLALFALSAGACSDAQGVTRAQLLPSWPLNLTREESFRSVEPPLGARRPWSPPSVERWMLANGLAVYFVPRPSSGSVRVSLVARHAGTQDVRDAPGVALLAASLLSRGTTAHPAGAHFLALRSLGAVMGVDVSGVSMEVSVAATAAQLAPATALLGEAVTSPQWSPEIFARELDVQRDVRRIYASRVATLGVSLAAQARDGAHSTARPHTGTLAQIGALDEARVREFYGRHFNALNCAVLVVGGATRADVEAAISAAFARLPASGAALEAPSEPVSISRGEPRWRVYDNEDAPNATITIAWPTDVEGAPGYAASRVLEEGLGSMFSSRLNRVLRERFGVTYGVQSARYIAEERSFVAARITVDVDLVAVALETALQQLGAVYTSGFTEGEVEAGKARLRDEFVARFETDDGVVDALRALVERGRTPEAWAADLAAIDAVDVAAVRNAATRQLYPLHIGGSIVGALDRFGARLRSEYPALRWSVATVSP
ncbi:MAG: insulinase family protein [Myxococcales bacterium]|nr:insulinase family protein [Myxococcales bacterium]